ncbi:prealbumin-like fold domain-containing protein [Leucobacter aridicollis]|uniref:Gram-positive cocci surface proteins LPxTG domain-containing protein n=1 Tax=Leucobacter aridicollis TaxID=283878 RepID=A0A852R606_9MICO|nr:prealbumin-like fold domain-containing protein [Leucobacter aridicollis]MBL3682028.1 hypothetical protein [Leucobacter aridicollis]NYD26925.1 hypothetical protein [Leucobacter aridicollis]
MSIITRTRRTAFGLATLAVAATAITIPLIAQPLPAQAAAGGCTAAPTTLLIAKTDLDGRPLADATFQVDAQHWDVNSPLSPGFAANPLYGEFSAAQTTSDEARQAADDARTVLHDAQAARADAQAILDELLADAGAQSPPELAALYEQESSQSVALSEAQDVLATAQEHLTAAEWGGDSVEIAAAQAAVETATQAVADAEAVLVEIRAEIDALIAAGPSADEIADAHASLTAATAAAKDAAAEYDAADRAAITAARATERIWIDAFEQVTHSTVTTDEDGQAAVEVVGYASCTNGATGAQDIAHITAPVVTEIEAPAGFRLDETPHTAEQLDDGSWTVTVVNEPVEEPEDPIEPPTPLIQTGTDLTAPLTLGAILAAAGGVLASGQLLRHIRRRSA